MQGRAHRDHPAADVDADRGRDDGPLRRHDRADGRALAEMAIGHDGDVAEDDRQAGEVQDLAVGRVLDVVAGEPGERPVSNLVAHADEVSIGSLRPTPGPIHRGFPVSTRTVSGTLIFQAKPAVNALVCVEDTRLATRTDDQGRYAFTNVPAGAQELVFILELAERRSREIFVPREADLVVPPVAMEEIDPESLGHLELYEARLELDSDPLDEGASCPVHPDHRLVKVLVPVRIGLMDFDAERFWTWRREFPFATTWFAGGCMPYGPGYAWGLRCAGCRAVEAEYKQRWRDSGLDPD